MEGYIGGSQEEEMMSADFFGRYKTEAEERIDKKGKASAKKQGKIGETHRDIRGTKPRDRNENVFARPNELLCQNAENRNFM